MQFDPERAKAEARRQNPALDAAYTRQEAEKQRYLEPVIMYFSRLEEEILGMPIARRFRRDRRPNFTLAGIVEGSVLPQFRNLSEADYKRAQLLIDLQAARTKAMGLIGEIESIVMDMEATKLD